MTATGPKFNIGDMAWMGLFDTSENFIPCPDCGGTGRIRVILHDDTQVSIGCVNCSPGFDQPTGRIRTYDRKPRADQVHVNGMEITSAGVRYHLGYNANCYRVAEEHQLFDNEPAALAHAAELATAAAQDEQKRIACKEKDTRSWAWNATYHRQNIKRAQRDLEYHTAKLNVAALKSTTPQTGSQE